MPLLPTRARGRSAVHQEERWGGGRLKVRVFESAGAAGAVRGRGSAMGSKLLLPTADPELITNASAMRVHYELRSTPGGDDDGQVHAPERGRGAAPRTRR